VKIDFQEMSRGLLVVPSNVAWQLEHVCMGVLWSSLSCDLNGGYGLMTLGV
jgi:hypothetical protein